jgi:hypothetical protein
MDKRSFAYSIGAFIGVRLSFQCYTPFHYHTRLSIFISHTMIYNAIVRKRIHKIAQRFFVKGIAMTGIN